ncbi:MAG: methyltransferase domain-containing protein, partial [Candidatus Aminicenantes bacterium]|nr:methyltransferase domain-containing protein [Candidatus Aminicenantes bacterium]
MALIFLSRAPAQQKKPEAPYVSTPDEVVAEMLRIANVDKDDVLYDLGCGDGRIVITAAKMFGCRGVGIDIDPERIIESRENAIKAGVSDKVRFIQMDLFEAEIREASVVTIYLLSGVNLRLRPKLFLELGPGSRVVSHEFSMGKWEPDVTSSVKTENYRDPYLFNYWDEQIADSWHTHTLYLWIIPGNVKGTWKLIIPDITGNDKVTLRFDQEFQQVRGQVLEGASSISVLIKDVKIRGNMLLFTLERKLKGRTESLHFEGIIQGNTMRGTMEIEGGPGKGKIKWTARRDLSTLRPIINSRK